MRAVLCVLLALSIYGAPRAPASAQVSPIASAFAGPGPYATGWREVMVARSAGSGFPATVYYPAAAPGGADAPVDPADGPHPAITFGHGFLQAVSSYSSTLRHLAAGASS